MDEALVTITGWLILFLLIGLFRAWYYGYASIIDWWYQRINTNPKAGVWYYGSRENAYRRVRRKGPQFNPWFAPDQPHRRKKLR